MSTVQYIRDHGHTFGYKKIRRIKSQAKKEIEKLRHEFTKPARLKRMITGQFKRDRNILRLQLNEQKLIIRILNDL